MPRKTNRLPVAQLISLLTRGRSITHLRIIAAEMPYAVKIITVRTMKIVPNTIIWTETVPEVGLTNWGINAIKNKATFGLSALTSNEYH